LDFNFVSGFGINNNDMKKVFVLALMGMVTGFSMWTCKHKPDVIPKSNTPVDTTHPPVSTCSPDTVYFTNTILPMIVSNCAMAGCHDAITRAEGLDLTNYANIARNVKAGNPSGSKLYRNMTGIEDIMPPKGILPQATLDAFYKWIMQGAKNNTCNDGNSNCDTLLVSYSASVVPLINNYCKGCHNSSTVSGSVNLDNYNGVLTTANNGQLMGGLTGKLSAMPKYGAALSPCNIGMFRQWIKEGAKNN
jgi:hypothetical protein